jgi:hypothetical protein
MSRKPRDIHAHYSEQLSFSPPILRSMFPTPQTRDGRAIGKLSEYRRSKSAGAVTLAHSRSRDKQIRITQRG